MARVPLLVIAAGGTGGHMFPAQALAEEMLARGWRVTLSTDERGARFASEFPAEVGREIVRSGTITGGGIIGKARALARIMAGAMAAGRSMRRDSPTVVAGFGGYPAIPALVAAIITRRPRLIHEQNGVLGRVNRLFARYVRFVACGTWPTRVPSGAIAVHTGNPVRRTVLDLHGTHYRPPSAQNELFLLVIGGSQGASVLAQMVPEAVALLPLNLCHRLRVSQQSRPEDAAQVIARYEDLGIQAEIAPFFADVPRRLADAQLVISRAGASSVADISVIGRPSILIPFAAALDDHQTANARPLAEAGGALVIQEADLTPAVLAGHMAAILGDPELARDMAGKAATVGKPAAAAELADLVEALARTKTGLTT